MTKLPKDFGRIKMEEEMLSNKQTMKMSDYRKELRQRADEWHKEEMLRQDAKRRMKTWREENDEGDGIIMFVIIVAVAILIGDFVLRIIY